ncbi:TPA: hypothetical protein I7142_24775 [Vibrio vulnificus]|nr:hypothetical protein [Vibrio vulnificus]HAS6037001.1 hypothetical protein [Vibrio vulnificus]HAS6410445.1 hypothetical protein [Vibrio vulnificus]HAS6415489.1 hypothetical protein [Vibrio vulnificus]
MFTSALTAIQENTAILGNQSIESVTVFNFNGSYWIENQRLNSPTPQKNDYFGSSVAISHDTVIVGAYG